MAMLDELRTRLGDLNSENQTLRQRNLLLGEENARLYKELNESLEDRIRLVQEMNKISEKWRKLAYATKGIPEQNDRSSV